MKRIFIAGLMLMSAFALTNCSKEIAQPAPDFNEQVAGVASFEIYAPTLQTKTANDGMSTVWVANDQIHVFHAEAGASSYVNDGNFVIYEQNLADGLFLGSLAETLSAPAYDWYFFYPYTSGVKTPAAANGTAVTLGSKAGEVQTQNGNNSMAHIAGVNYPMCAVAKNVAASQTPTAEMKHMTALVAINVVNNTDAAMTVVSAGLKASESLVGTYYMDFTGAEVVYTDAQTSNVANLEVVGGQEIAAGASAKFYFAVKPFTAEADSRLTVYVNGSQKSIKISETTEFKAGKIKTINVPVERLQHPTSTATDIKSKYFVPGDNTDPRHNAVINGVNTKYVVKIGTEKSTGSVVLKGSLSDFVNLTELGFFAASWTGKQGAVTIDNVAVIFPEGMLESMSQQLTAEQIVEMVGEKTGKEDFTTDDLIFAPAPAGTFVEGSYSHNLTILDENLHYYGITEDRLNAMLSSTGLSIDDLRALINGEGDIKETLRPIAESFGYDISSLEQYIPLVEMFLPEIRKAEVQVTLKTITKDLAGNTYDPRTVFWGMNLFFK